MSKNKTRDVVQQAFRDFAVQVDELFIASFHWANHGPNKVDPRLVQHAVRRYHRKKEIPECVAGYFNYMKTAT